MEHHTVKDEKVPNDVASEYFMSYFNGNSRGTTGNEGERDATKVLWI